MKPLVSICCKTYNHEKYISDAIDSFLMQKTDFPLEIIIHDDASTDNTANIIKEYENKYPDIIKPIYQKENQYSKGVNTSINYIYPKVQGKYISLCEGDDFWVDSRKLKKQIEFLESHNDYSMCFHAVKIVDTKKHFSGKYMGPYGKGSKTYSINKIGQGGFVHLSSIVMKAEFFKGTFPDWYVKQYRKIGGDFKLAIYLGIEGKTYYMDEVMSAYRTGVENSAMSKMKRNFSIQDHNEYHNLRNSIIDEIDVFYNYKYHSELEEIKLHSEIIKLKLENGLENNLPKTKSQSVYKYLSLRTKAIMYLKYYMPGLYRFGRLIYNKINSHIAI